MSVPNPDMRDKAYRLCKDYLNGAWKLIKPEEMVLKQISGGLSNFLYYCALPNTRKPKHGEPARVLLRLYGQVHGEGALEAVVTESVIFTLLSERKLGPKLHGVFPGGRLEEFIPARPLKTIELADPDLSCTIAEKMALIHTLNVPISKEPTWLWNTMKKWMCNMNESMKTFTPTLEQQPFVSHVMALKLEAEMTWLRKFLTQLQSPVAFCHNDMQEGNILLRENAQSPAEKLVIIDFEYCSYNYRGFDIANHFCEWAYNYTVPQHPNFRYTPTDYPNVEEQLRFIRVYLETQRRENAGLTSSTTTNNNNKAYLYTEDVLFREVQCFMLASHFFWALWGVVNAPVSTIPFGYFEYAAARFDAYYEHKEHLLHVYGTELNNALD